MGFRPIVLSPGSWICQLFSEVLMKLDDRLLNRPLPDRLSFDADLAIRCFSARRISRPHGSDVEAIRSAVLEVFDRVRHKFSAVINYDSSDIAPHVADKWFFHGPLTSERTCYDHCSRYTTSAFMRLKLGDALSRRDVAPAYFLDLGGGPRVCHPLGDVRTACPIGVTFADIS